MPTKAKKKSSPFLGLVALLRELRLAKGISQSTLAKMAGVKKTTVANYERSTSGAVAWDILDRLAIALGVTIFPEAASAKRNRNGTAKDNNMTLVAQFGLRLRELRLARGISQSTLAEMAGVHKVAVSCFERGTRGSPGLDILDRLARALGVTPGELLDPPTGLAPKPVPRRQKTG